MHLNYIFRVCNTPTILKLAVVSPTHLNNRLETNRIISPKVRGENNKYLKPPPSMATLRSPAKS